MPWRGPNEPGEFATLGYDIGEWVQANVVVPDGYRRGEPYLLTDEMWRFLLHFYRIDPHEERLHYYGAQFRRSQKYGKDPFGAAIVLAEGLGPARFDGWNAYGEPVGAPYPTPYIPCLGTSEEQTDNTYRPLLDMIRLGPLADLPGMDAGETRVKLPGGEIEPVTASARARLGQRMTMATLTEALALDTPLPTPTGWTTAGDVAAGDRLLGANGLPTEVIKATGVADDRPCWRLTFADGTSIVADDGHLWQTMVRSSGALPRVRTTGEMARDGRVFRVPVAAPAKLPEVPLPIDPYVLGLWLADGDARNATITVSKDDLAATKALIEDRGYTCRECQVSPKHAALLYVSLPGSHRNRHSPVKGLKVRLREQGLLANKHIPLLYLRAGVQQRIDLLCGLMDGDGCVTREGTCFFSQSRPDLAADAAELLRSLGQIVSERWGADSRSRYGGGYRLNFTPRGGLVPFALPRKGSRVRQTAKGERWTTIKTIEAVPTVPVRCVAVDAPDHLFLAGDGWHVTHNTHLWTIQGGFRKLAGAVKRNIAGMDGRWLELTNAWDPTEGSEAQVTAESGNDRVLIDTVEPRRVEDLADDEDLYRELLRQYGDSARERGGWVNIRGRIMHEVRDTAHLEADRRRFFLNEIVVGESVFVDPVRWDLQARPGETLAPGEPVALGFDGAKYRDATALVASRLSDARLFEVAVWERPPDAGRDWRVPSAEVDRVVCETFGAYQVAVMFADPYRWQDYLDAWARKLGADNVVEFPTNAEQRMDAAIERFTTAFSNLEITHGGTPVMTRHFKNAVLVKGGRKKPRPGEDQSLATHYLKMAKRADGMLIDAAVAGVLAHAARAWTAEHTPAASTPFALWG